jgi:hypothetical protein
MCPGARCRPYASGSVLPSVLPNCAEFAGKKWHASGKIDVITLVHVKMAVRAWLLDIRAQLGQSAEEVPDAVARVHFVRVLDSDSKEEIAILLMGEESLPNYRHQI